MAYFYNNELYEMEDMCERENERKRIMGYIVLSLVHYNILQETSIYKEAMSSDQETIE
jgi:hypothetical protein